MRSRGGHQNFSIDFYTAYSSPSTGPRLPMPSFKTISIGLTAALVLLLGFMWWGGKTAEPPAARAIASSAAPQLSLRTVETAPPSRAEASPNAQVVAAKSAANEPGRTDVQSAPAAPPLPLLIHFYRRMRDPEQRIEGSIENTSNDDLEITLNVLSAATHTVSRSTLGIPSQSRVVFGRDDGLNLGAGDQVTLQATTYGDLVQEINLIR